MRYERTSQLPGTENTMSFRHKDREAEGDDVKVAYEKDSKQGKPEEQSSGQQASQQTTEQQSGQESGQPAGQTDEQQSEQQQSSDDEDDDKSDESDESDDEPVPDGTTAEILRWVGDDKGRAVRALEKERADSRPRAGLTGELTKILE